VFNDEFLIVFYSYYLFINAGVSSVGALLALILNHHTGLYVVPAWLPTAHDDHADGHIAPALVVVLCLGICSRSAWPH
jgi:hypothetical protein